MNVLLVKLCVVFALMVPALSAWSQSANPTPAVSQSVSDPAVVFRTPPEMAKPGVLWMWMGSNLSKSGITRDLEALPEAGFNRTTMFSLADVTSPWSGEIGNSPTPELIAWTEPWQPTGRNSGPR